MRCSWSLLRVINTDLMKNRKSFSMFTMFLNCALWNLRDYPKPRAAGMSHCSAVSHIAHSDYTGLSLSSGNMAGHGSRVGSQAQRANMAASYGVWPSVEIQLQKCHVCSWKRDKNVISSFQNNLSLWFSAKDETGLSEPPRLASCLLSVLSCLFYEYSPSVN